MIQFPNVGRRTITSNYTTNMQDSYIEADTSDNDITIVLSPFAASTYNPIVSAQRGYQCVTIKKTSSSNTLTIEGYGTITVNSTTSIDVTAINDSITFLYSPFNADYRIISSYTAGSSVSPSALTKVDDTNVTLTLGGTPGTALLQATSLTLGWTGTLADGRIASAATWNAKASTAYVDAKKHGWGGLVGSVVATGATNYINPGNTANATENNVKVPCGFAGTFVGISVYLSTAQPGTGSLVLTLRINGANTALTFTIPAGSAAGVYSDLANTVAFTAGDTYNLSVLNNAAANSGSIRSVQYTCIS